MSTTFRQWCDRLLEVGWLLAVVLVTLYFNIYTKDSRIFEPQKALVLRTLVTMMLALWAARTLDENRHKLAETDWWRKAVWAIVLVSALLSLALFVVGLVTWEDPLAGLMTLPAEPGGVAAPVEPRPVGVRVLLGVLGMGTNWVVFCGLGLALVGAGYALHDSWKAVLRTAMVIPALLYIAVHIISTIGSVFPYASLFGGYVRQQGTLTVLAYSGLFFLLAFNLRQREQLRRLITMILLASIPAALYGAVQKLGVDPLPWMGDVERRVASTMGNAIFIAAYLIMVFPLTLYRLLSTWERLRQSPPPEETPSGGNGILGPTHQWLLWGGVGLVLAAVLVFAPIALWSKQLRLQQTPGVSAAEIAQIWPGYRQGLLLFVGTAILTVALPALLYLLLTLLKPRRRSYAHLTALGTAVLGSAALMLIGDTRTNGLAWAGYLLGLFVLALLSRRQHLEEPWGSDALWADAGYILVVMQSLLLFMAIQAYLPTSPSPSRWWVYLAALLAFLASCYPLLAARIRGRVGYRAQLGGYALLALIQLLCIGLTQSRGPYTGLLAGLFVFLLLWTWRRRIRWALIGVLVLAALGGLFLAVFNLPNTPLIGKVAMQSPQVASFVENQLEPLKGVPYLGRLGRIFDASEGTGKVRILIWFGDEIGEGSIGLIKAHPLRTLIGYGPEAMHVAYNPYYPPELAHVEKRNASPDRAHNAIIDELVTLGVVGLSAYLFYFIAFFILTWQLLKKAPDVHNQTLLIGLFGLGVAHFVETLTGIPIVATRMYMWIAIGITVALTFLPPFRKPIEQVGEEGAVEERPSSRKRRRDRRRRRAPQGVPTGWTVAYIAILLGAFIVAARVHIKPMWADILYWQAKQMEAQAEAYGQQSQRLGDAPQAEEFAAQAADYAYRGLRSLHRAISLLPREDFYFLSIAQTYLNGAQSARNNAERQAFFESTEYTISRARDLSFLNTDHYRNLSALYLAWFSQTREPERLARAIAYGEQAISLTRNNADLRNRLARAYMTAADSSAQVRQTILPQALDWLQNWEQYHLTSGGRAGDTHLPLVADYRRQALDLLQSGNLWRGLLVLSAAELQYSLFLDEQYEDTCLLLGDLYRTLQMPAEAALQYGQGIRLKPRLLNDAMAETRFRFVVEAGQEGPLVDAYLDMVARSEAALERLADQDKPAQKRRHYRWAADSLQALGFIYILKGENEQAIAYYEQALAHRKTTEAYRNLVVLYQQTGQLDLAIQRAQEGLELAQQQGNSQEAQNFQNAIQQLQSQGDVIRRAEEAVAADPQNYRPHFDLADLYKQAGRMEQALREAQTAADLVPAEDIEAVRQVYIRLGNYAFLQNRYDLAESAFLRVLEVAPDNFTAHYKLAQIYQAWNRLEEALTHAEAALAVAPENKQVEVQGLVDQLKNLLGGDR